MENIPQTAQTAVVKSDFHNEPLDDPEKDSAGSVRACPCARVHPCGGEGARSALCSFIQLWSTHLFTGIPPTGPLHCQQAPLLTREVPALLCNTSLVEGP